mgnify:CR=1 FL=1
MYLLKMEGEIVMIKMVKKDFIELYCNEYNIEVREEGKRQVEKFLKIICLCVIL